MTHVLPINDGELWYFLNQSRTAYWTARVASARQRRDTDAICIPGRGRANARRHERARPWPLPLLVLPAKASPDVCACSVSTQSARRVVGVQAPRAPERAAQRFSSCLTGSAGHRIDLVSHVGCVVRRSQLGVCTGAPTHGRRLALHDVMSGFLPGSKRTARLDSALGEVYACLDCCPNSRPASLAATVLCDASIELALQPAQARHSLPRHGFNRPLLRRGARPVQHVVPSL